MPLYLGETYEPTGETIEVGKKRKRTEALYKWNNITAIEGRIKAAITRSKEAGIRKIELAKVLFTLPENGNLDIELEFTGELPTVKKTQQGTWNKCLALADKILKWKPEGEKAEEQEDTSPLPPIKEVPEHYAMLIEFIDEDYPRLQSVAVEVMKGAGVKENKTTKNAAGEKVTTQVPVDRYRGMTFRAWIKEDKTKHAKMVRDAVVKYIEANK